MSELFTKLLNGGPMTKKELGRAPSLEERQDGVTKFSLSGGRGSSQSGTGYGICVYYIENKHSAESVMKKWLSENNTENVSDAALHLRACKYGVEFKQASRNILSNIQNGKTGNYTPGGVCPNCDSEYSRHLPDHIPECDAL